MHLPLCLFKSDLYLTLLNIRMTIRQCIAGRNSDLEVRKRCFYVVFVFPQLLVESKNCREAT